jgi:hypothetical protein
MQTDLDTELHALIRNTYIKERRNFEFRISGVPSSYGYKHMPKWDGTEEFRPGASSRSSQDRYGKTYKPIWPRIATYAVRNGVDPLELIRNRFRDTHGPVPPEPTDCMSVKALEACNKNSVDVETLNVQLEEMAKLYLLELENRSRYILKYPDWTPEKVIHSVVTDLTIPFNPLFRFYLAHINELNQSSQDYRNTALLEYIRSKKAFDKSNWTTILPVDFKEEIRVAAI